MVSSPCVWVRVCAVSILQTFCVVDGDGHIAAHMWFVAVVLSNTVEIQAIYKKLLNTVTLFLLNLLLLGNGYPETFSLLHVSKRCAAEVCLTTKTILFFLFFILLFHSFDPEGFELSTRFYRGLIAGHRAVRHGRLQGIPKELTASCTRKKKQNTRVKTNEWKHKVAEDLTCEPTSGPVCSSAVCETPFIVEQKYI